MTNLELAPHQQRVVGEKAELGERLRKLTAFIDSPGFAALLPDERARLQKQFVFMEAYAGVLDERIAAFTTAAAQPKRYTSSDIDDLRWATGLDAMDPLSDKVNVWARMKDGKEFRGAFTPIVGERIGPAAAAHALRIANGEQP